MRESVGNRLSPLGTEPDVLTSLGCPRRRKIFAECGNGSLPGDRHLPAEPGPVSPRRSTAEQIVKSASVQRSEQQTRQVSYLPVSGSATGVRVESIDPTSPPSPTLDARSEELQPSAGPPPPLPNTGRLASRISALPRFCVFSGPRIFRWWSGLFSRPSSTLHTTTDSCSQHNPANQHQISPHACSRTAPGCRP